MPTHVLDQHIESGVRKQSGLLASTLLLGEPVLECRELPVLRKGVLDCLPESESDFLG